MFGDFISTLTVESLATAIGNFLSIPVVPALGLSVMGLGLVIFVFRRLARLLQMQRAMDCARRNADADNERDYAILAFLAAHPRRSVQARVAEELGVPLSQLVAPSGHGPGYSVTGAGPEMDELDAEEVLQAERQADYEREMAAGPHSEDVDWDEYRATQKAFNKSNRRHDQRLARLEGRDLLPF
jgi:hypothetical protein